MAESVPQSRPATPLISISAEGPLDLNAVEIVTDRLTLRPVTAAFTELIFAEFTPEITKYMLPSSPRHISETEQFIANTLEKRSRGSDLVLAILAKDTDEFLGCCGLHGRENPRARTGNLAEEVGSWSRLRSRSSRRGPRLGRTPSDRRCLHLPRRSQQHRQPQSRGGPGRHNRSLRIDQNNVRRRVGCRRLQDSARRARHRLKARSF